MMKADVSSSASGSELIQRRWHQHHHVRLKRTEPLIDSGTYLDAAIINGNYTLKASRIERNPESSALPLLQTTPQEQGLHTAVRLRAANHPAARHNY